MKARLLVLLTALLAACSYAPDYSKVANCELKCSASGACPDGFDCAAGYCVRPGYDVDSCFELKEPSATIWLCRGGDVELEAEGAADVTWSESADERLPVGVSIKGDKLRIGTNPELSIGAQTLHVSASIGAEERDVPVTLDVKECLGVTKPSVAQSLCRGSHLGIPLVSRGGFGVTQWTIASWTLDGKAPSNPALLSISGNELTSVAGAVPGLYSVKLSAQSAPAIASDDAPFDDVQTTEVEFEVGDCYQLTAKCEPVAETFGVAPDNLPVFCVERDQGIQIRCTAQGADFGTQYQWNWQNGTGPEDVRLKGSAETGIDGSTRTFTGETGNADPTIKWTATFNVFVPDSKMASTDASVSFHTTNCPEMENTVLPSATVGEEYVVPLTLKPPGDSKSVMFESVDKPDWLKFELGAGFTALVGTPEVAGEVSFSLRVVEPSDGGFSALRLKIKVTDRPDVPAVLGKPEFEKILPTACSGQPYEALLVKNAGEYSWAWNLGFPGALPDWAELVSKTVDGKQNLYVKTKAGKTFKGGGEGNQTLHLKGTILNQAERSFDPVIPSIRSCKYAYLTQAGSVKLGDLRNSEQEIATINLTDPVAAVFPGFQASSFVLSPDGSAVIQVGAGTAGPCVAVTELVTQLVAVTALSSTGLSASWSPDSDGFVLMTDEPTLASRKLGAFTRAGSLLNELYLPDGDLPAEGRRAELTWAGNRICAPAVTELTSDSLLCPEFSPITGLEVASLNYLIGQQMSLRDPRTVIYANPDFLAAISYISVEGYHWSTGQAFGDTASLATHITAIPDPGLHWWAQTDVILPDGVDTGIGIFGIGEESFFQVATRFVPGCEMLTAWSAAGSALACRSQTRDFVADIPTDPEQPVTVHEVVGGGAYASQFRTFSRDEKWFVFQDDAGGISKVRLSGETRIAQKVLEQVGPVAKAVPLGNGSQMLLHSGSVLVLADLESNKNSTITTASAGPSTCEPDAGIADLYGWCGSSLPVTTFAVSPTGEGIIWLGTDGNFRATWLTAAQTTHSLLDNQGALAPCDSVRGCQGAFQFLVPE